MYVYNTEDRPGVWSCSDPRDTLSQEVQVIENSSTARRRPIGEDERFRSRPAINNLFLTLQGGL